MPNWTQKKIHEKNTPPSLWKQQKCWIKEHLNKQLKSLTWIILWFVFNEHLNLYVDPFAMEIIMFKNGDGFRFVYKNKCSLMNCDWSYYAGSTRKFNNPLCNTLSSGLYKTERFVNCVGWFNVCIKQISAHNQQCNDLKDNFFG